MNTLVFLILRAVQMMVELGHHAPFVILLRQIPADIGGNVLYTDRQ